LVEKYANENRIGIVEIGESLQNAIDNIYSNQVDNIEDIVNEMLIFKNCILGNTPEEKSQNLIDARKNGVLEITDPSENREADVKTLSTQLNHSDILTLLESLKNELYATCGVPIAVSDTSNGGNKQGALQLGNGWENSYDRLLDEINSFLIADYELLDKMLFICKKSKTSKLNELNASEIEIKYNPNMTDNILSKSQAIQIFDNCNIPPELYIQWVRISNDAVTAAQIIKEYRESLGNSINEESNNGNNNI
jgi:SPP1 family phage portal protein